MSATALTVEVLSRHYSPVRIGVLFLPELGGAVVTALVLGMVLQQARLALPAVGRHDRARRPASPSSGSRCPRARR